MTKAVICATSTSVKSFMLKIVEMMRRLEEKIFLEGSKWVVVASSRLSNFAKCFRDQSIVLELKVNPDGVNYFAERFSSCSELECCS